MEIKLKKWNKSDINSLIELCNNVDRDFLSNRIPYPYTEKDAKWWLNMVDENDEKSAIFRAIVVDDEIVGTISVEKKEDVYCKDAEIGYFLSKINWNKGIMADAVGKIC